MKIKRPKPVLWGIDEQHEVSSIVHAYLKTLPEYCSQNQSLVMSFLKMYQASRDTYQTYRRELERWLQWCWLVRKVSILNATRDDVLAFLKFCKSPPLQWIGDKLSSRFSKGEFNDEWYVFVNRRKGQASKLSAYQWSESASKIMIATLSTFYTYCLQEQQVYTNPVQAIRQKKRLYQSHQHQRVMRKLSDHQWRYVINQLLHRSVNDVVFERHLFVLSMFFLLGLRISELAASDRHHPVMGDFFQDHSMRWWFKTLGKGNKWREIAVPDACMDALKRYRLHLGMTAMPTPGDSAPLVHKMQGVGGLQARQIRNLVQEAFDLAICKLQSEGFAEDARHLSVATVHWLRHTSISHDVQHRPREHVRDDAGHHHVGVTDQYVEIDLEARYISAKDKPLVPNTD
ncbi:MAG: tyrosine-type recombinase/integrase [Candidatus Comchoanobacterales bacterium]